MSLSLMRRAKSLLGHGLVTSRLHRVLLGSDAIIVAFHRVNDDLPEDGLNRTSADFERFCRFFRSNFDVVALDEQVSRLERGASIGGTLAITFDDGYLDNFEVAAPILRRLGLPATFFVTTHFIGSSTAAWWDAELPRQPGWMSWDQVRTLASEGFDIGGHTRTHADLGTITGPDADWEIAGSRQDILNEVGRAPRHFSLPYGRPDHMLDANREQVKAAGFHSCVSCYGGLARSGSDPYRLQRVGLGYWFRTPEQFAFEALTHRA